MKRLVLSAMLASSLLALSARESRADGFSFDLHLSGSASFNCWSGCGPGYGSCGPCPPCYNFGPCFAPAFSTLGYGAPPAGYYDRIGYPGYPGTPMGYPQAAYGYPSAAPSYAPQAAPGNAPPPAQPTAQQVGYYQPSGYAVPSYWYGR